ncbi:fibronectin type III domain-containing protein [Nocardioides sambongensis]|uniref:fibronectin type III domain-containing protein n=1 Tax=Nocardioides sambongensis TaxID=2589074 RepID=UPI00112D5A84|nr:fibronectin type III domain-containing protein [Nocardioides sambongensis]
MVSDRRTRPLALAAAGGLGLSLLLTAPTSTAVDEGAIPDRIVLNPTPTPATSQEVTWRTDSAVTEGVVEYGPAEAGRWPPSRPAAPRRRRC